MGLNVKLISCLNQDLYHSETSNEIVKKKKNTGERVWEREEEDKLFIFLFSYIFLLIIQISSYLVQVIVSYMPHT